MQPERGFQPGVGGGLGLGQDLPGDGAQGPGVGLALGMRQCAVKAGQDRGVVQDDFRRQEHGR